MTTKRMSEGYVSPVTVLSEPVTLQSPNKVLVRVQHVGTHAASGEYKQWNWFLRKNGEPGATYEYSPLPAIHGSVDFDMVLLLDPGSYTLGVGTFMCNDAIRFTFVVG